MPKRKTTEQLIEEFASVRIHSIESGTEIELLDGLRKIGAHRGKVLRKNREQLKEERKRQEDLVFLEKAKTEIARRLKIQNIAANVPVKDFWVFLLVNFRVQGDKFEKRLEKFLMPREITPEISTKAAKEADERRIKKYLDDSKRKEE